MTKTEYRVMIGPPGPNFSWGTVQGLLACTTSKHNVELMPSGNGFDDFDIIWCHALNASEEGKITHLAMLHLDIAPEVGDDRPLWLDTLIDELDAGQLDMVSAISPIKDARGLTSSGIGDPNDPWCPYRRLVMRELDSLPKTFNAADLGHPDKPLLHNSGCWVADLRSPVFHREDADGTCGAYFAFPERVYRDKGTGKWVHARESEDWFFSRCLWKLNAKTAITRKVRLRHYGNQAYPNFGTWGEWDHDLGTSRKWAVPSGPWDAIPGWFDFADIYQEQIDRVNGTPAHFVEVGSWLGKSAVFMGTRIAESGKSIRLHCVDNWQGGSETSDNGYAARNYQAGRDLYAEFWANISNAGLQNTVLPLRMDSSAAAQEFDDDSLDFVFIDADHEQSAVERDLEAYFPKVKPGGVIAGHDYDEQGPRAAVKAFTARHGLTAVQRMRSFTIQK